MSGVSTIHQDSHGKDSSKEKEVGKKGEEPNYTSLYTAFFIKRALFYHISAADESLEQNTSPK